jgi:hypothetical protein
MTGSRSIRTARLAGVLAGVALAAALLLAGRPASGGETVGADVSVYANQTGELAVSPAGPARFVNDPLMRPGQSASGRFRVTNQTGVTESIRLAALPSAHDLDGSLDLRLASNGETLVDGSLASLAKPGGTPLVLWPGESRTVSVTVSLSPAASDEVAAAALVEIAVTFEPESVRWR